MKIKILELNLGNPYKGKEHQYSNIKEEITVEKERNASKLIFPFFKEVKAFSMR